LFKKITAAILCLSLILAFSACSSKSPKNANKKIHYQLSAEPKTLDPQIASDSPSLTVISALFEGLVRLDKDNKPYPGVAESWQSSENDTVFTFTLRKDAKWSDKDNTPVTANDFVFAFQRALAPQTNSPTCSPMFCIQNAKEVNSGAAAPNQLGVTAPNAQTLVVRLKHPYPDFPSLTASAVFMPCNQKLFEATHGRYGLERDYTRGNGPFVIDGKYGWDHDKYINLVRSDTYKGQNTPLPVSVKFTIENEDNKITDQISALTAGTVDAIQIPVNRVEDAKKSGCAVKSFEDTIWGLCFNTQSEVMKNLNIRKAFIQSLNRDQLLKNIPQNTNAAENIIPPLTTFMKKNYRSLVNNHPYYLGYDDNAPTTLNRGLRELSKSELGNISVICLDDPQVKLMVNDMIAAWNTKFDHYFNMEPLSEEDLAERIKSEDYQIALCPVEPSTDGPLSVLSIFKSESKNNPACLSDSTFDKLVENAENSYGIEAAQDFAKAEKRLQDIAVFYPLYYGKHYFASGKGVTGVVFQPYGGGMDFIMTGKE
jgi:oligopeptide transport system substrate-binding protein